MPWAATDKPSIALGILKSLCTSHSLPCQVFYPNLDLAEVMSSELYDQFGNNLTLYGLSEYLFAADLFGINTLGGERTLDVFGEALNLPDVASSSMKIPKKLKDKGYLLHLRDYLLPAFLDRLTTRLLQEEATVFGFTATNNQVMSGLAIAKRLKALRPEVITIFGGANFHGTMGLEYARALPGIIDHIFVGEAEEAFSEFLIRLVEGRELAGIPGVTSMAGEQVALTPGQPLEDMSLSPCPDYDDFFAEAERIRQLSGKVFPVEFLPFEGARGCWWGE
ncbi:MAG: hypothetical protein FWF06_06955, partial [Symbiobacteriaceae bacterium]|nr:hypothetical protein [Symbiobacteriaceae bacterium]